MDPDATTPQPATPSARELHLAKELERLRADNRALTRAYKRLATMLKVLHSTIELAEDTDARLMTMLSHEARHYMQTGIEEIYP